MSSQLSEPRSTPTATAHARGSWREPGSQTRGEAAKTNLLHQLPSSRRSRVLERVRFWQRHVVGEFAVCVSAGARDSRPAPLHSRPLCQFCTVSLQRPSMERRVRARVFGGLERERKQPLLPTWLLSSTPSSSPDGKDGHRD